MAKKNQLESAKAALQEAVEAARAQRATIEASLDKILNQLDDLRHAPIPDADLLRQVEESLAARAQYGRRKLITVLEGLRRPRFKAEEPQGHRSIVLPPENNDILARRAPDAKPGELDLDVLVFLFEPIIRERLHGVVEEQDWPTGAPLEERLPAIEKLEAEAETLESELAELEAQLVSALGG